MADTKISALDAITAILGEMLFAVVEDPSGTPVTKKATITQVVTFLNSVTQTLTNKSIDQDATGNSITNIADASIKALASIDASKIADGSVSSAEFQYLGDVTGLIQAQLDLLAPLTSANLVTPALGTPSAGVLTSCTGLPLTTGVTGILPSANMDADTAHLTTVQTFTGAKTFSALLSASLGIDLVGTNLDNIQKTIYDLTTITSSATIALDFNEDDLAKLALAHNTTFSTSNLAVGKTMEIHITSAAARTLAFPAGWTFYGTLPTTTTAGKDSVLQLTSIGTTDADVKAVFVEEA